MDVFTISTSSDGMGDERARDASYRYEAKLDAYNFLIGKFANYRAGKGFHDMPDGLFGERHY